MPPHNFTCAICFEEKPSSSERVYRWGAATHRLDHRHTLRQV